MRPMAEGWLWTRPFKIPKKCRHCGGPTKVVKRTPDTAGVVACVACDLVERWPGRG